jgi:hypothetical protein
MRRMLTTAGAMALAVMTIAGVAQANPSYPAIGEPPVLQAQNKSLQPAPWHYEWQYHYNKWANYVPGWVPVLNGAR